MSNDNITKQGFEAINLVGMVWEEYFAEEGISRFHLRHVLYGDGNYYRAGKLIARFRVKHK